ncbi:DUF1652 domain-containing protein [Pseudomonas gingeri]|uniref:DUF1652 domain-containing protein n=1 Tax=Pseudomonas gingeri TaxID=117681 RepID=UPI0034E97229
MSILADSCFSGVEMLSDIQLRHLVESSFLPLSCRCQIDSSRSLTVRIVDPDSGRIELLVSVGFVAELIGVREIGNLVEEIKEDLRLTHERADLCPEYIKSNGTDSV